jgi:hypothetical protein
MRFGSLIGAGRIATALAVTVGWLVVAAVVDRPLLVPVARAATSTFSNTTSIVFPATPPGEGPATPYPSQIAVAGVAAPVVRVTVTLSGLSHTFPEDVGVVVTSPTGTTVRLMSDVGGPGNIGGVNLTFDDAAPVSLPNNATISSGTYRPTAGTNNGGSSSPVPFPGGPPAPYNPSLASFNGASANGAWSCTPLTMRLAIPGPSAAAGR